MVQKYKIDITVLLEYKARMVDTFVPTSLINQHSYMHLVIMKKFLLI